MYTGVDMNDQPVIPPGDEETIRRLQAAYDEFVAKLDALRKERFELAKQVVSRIEQQKLHDVIDSLKKSS